MNIYSEGPCPCSGGKQQQQVLRSGLGAEEAAARGFVRERVRGMLSHSV